MTKTKTLAVSLHERVSVSGFYHPKIARRQQATVSDKLSALESLEESATDFAHRRASANGSLLLRMKLLWRRKLTVLTAKL